MNKGSSDNTEEDKRLREKGEARWQEIKKIVGTAWCVAIEVDSGDYFFGNDTLEVADRARHAHPDKLFYFIRKEAHYIGPIRQV